MLTLNLFSIFGPSTNLLLSMNSLSLMLMFMIVGMGISLGCYRVGSNVKMCSLLFSRAVLCGYRHSMLPGAVTRLPSMYIVFNMVMSFLY